MVRFFAGFYLLHSFALIATREIVFWLVKVELERPSAKPYLVTCIMGNREIIMAGVDCGVNHHLITPVPTSNLSFPLVSLAFVVC